MVGMTISGAMIQRLAPGIGSTVSRANVMMHSPLVWTLAFLNSKVVAFLDREIGSLIQSTGLPYIQWVADWLESDLRACGPRSCFDLAKMRSRVRANQSISLHAESRKAVK